MKSLKQIKEPLMKHLFEDKPLPDYAVDSLLYFADDWFGYLGNFTNDMIEIVLPPTNVGKILIQKDFASVAVKIDSLCDKLYETNNDHAGWEYFSTICYAIGCVFEPLYEN